MTVIAIDGPAGSGKSTTARLVAEQVGLPHLDTGSLYRGVGLMALRSGIDLNRPGLETDQAVVKLLATLDIDIPQSGRLVVDGQDISADIRQPLASDAASKVGVLPQFRQALLPVQREFGRRRGCVADGRDVGTVVFPDANLKVFLTAEPTIRTRRMSQAQALTNDLSEVLADIHERDRRDANRAVAPLMPAADAVEIDNTHIRQEHVIELIVELARMGPVPVRRIFSQQPGGAHIWELHSQRQTV